MSGQIWRRPFPASELAHRPHKELHYAYRGSYQYEDRHSGRQGGDVAAAGLDEYVHGRSIRGAY